MKPSGATRRRRPQAGVEVEWQFDALDLRPVERWLAALPARAPELLGDPAQADGDRSDRGISALGPAPGESAPPSPEQSVAAFTALRKAPRRLADRYLDTDDWRIARAGYVLRIRRRGRHQEATLKELHPASATGLRRRTELTEVLADGELERLPPEGPVASRVRAVIGRRALREMVEIRTRRRPFSLRIGGEEVAELALDETTIAGNAERPVRLRRVEVEIEPDASHDLEPLINDLVAACGLRPASLSKFEAGLLGLGLTLPGPPQLGPVRVGPGSSLGEVAYAALRRQLSVLIRSEPGTRLGEDPEELHDMRVATRRLRAALALFSEVLPPRADGVRQELGWLGRALGEVRDLDVQLQRHADDARLVEHLLGERDDHPLDPLMDQLLREREAARTSLLDALDSPRYERLLEGLESMARSGPPPGSRSAREPAIVAVPDLIDRRHRAATKAAKRARRSGEPGDFHRLRIRCKRLRYALEFTSDTYEGAPSRFVRRLTRLQDALGALQDDETAVERLHRLATASDPPLPAATIYAIGGVAGHYRADQDRVLRRLGRRTRVLRRGAWQALEDLMATRRQDAKRAFPPAASLATSGVALLAPEYDDVRSPDDADGTSPAEAGSAPEVAEGAEEADDRSGNGSAGDREAVALTDPGRQPG